MRLLRRSKRFMKRIASGMYRTISSNTKLPVPDEQLKRGVVEKLQDPEPVTPKQRTNVGVMSKAQEDAFEKEYETYIAEQKKLKVEREAAEQTEATEPEVDVAESPVDEATEEPLNEAAEVIGEVTAESTEEVAPVQKKTSRKKKADAE